jgi:hypothetical protein
MLALCTALVSVFMVKGITHKKLATALLNQSQMEQFALSTPALAQSFLAFSAKEVKGVAQEAVGSQALKTTPADGDTGFGRLLLEKMLPVANMSQKFTMKEIVKEFPVIVNLTIFCEAGKININSFYDLINKKFYDEGVPGKDQKVFATWVFDRIAKLTEKPSLLAPFIEHVKQRKSQFNDVTELLAIKEFAACFQDSIFYEVEQKNKSADKKISKIYLTDIFTVSSENDTIQPWLLSPSVCALLDITQKSSKHEEFEKKESGFIKTAMDREKKIDLTSFKQQADWQKDWDLGLKSLYDVSYDKIPEPVRGMLSTQFAVTAFSMLATVKRESVENENNMMVRIFAILKQKRLPDDSIIYDVIKIYQV